MKTRQDLIKRTLELLNVIGSGQAPDAEDVQTIDDLIDGRLKELNRSNVMYFGDYDRFEDEFIDPLATILGDTAAPDFGQARDAVRVSTAENRLRSMNGSDWTPATVVPSVYF